MHAILHGPLSSLPSPVLRYKQWQGNQKNNELSDSLASVCGVAPAFVYQCNIDTRSRLDIHTRVTRSACPRLRGIRVNAPAASAAWMTSEAKLLSLAPALSPVIGVLVLQDGPRCMPHVHVLAQHLASLRYRRWALGTGLACARNSRTLSSNYEDSTGVHLAA